MLVSLQRQVKWWMPIWVEPLLRARFCILAMSYSFSSSAATISSSAATISLTSFYQNLLIETLPFSFSESAGKAQETAEAERAQETRCIVLRYSRLICSCRIYIWAKEISRSPIIHGIFLAAYRSTGFRSLMLWTGGFRWFCPLYLGSYGFACPQSLHQCHCLSLRWQTKADVVPR